MSDKKEIPQGWQCPICKKILSPYVKYCDCSQNFCGNLPPEGIGVPHPFKKYNFDPPKTGDPLPPDGVIISGTHPEE